ncbi:hypothetical protein CJF32_00003639 [Rutstroemia sp. NJR-2017a WRK4]|nr:hypothetical protein CJF32_00003639 [Rutstroemia sp. NJR-2017a WRK4]
MPSAFHTFKLVPAMAQTAPSRQSQPQPAPILPPSTPANSRPSPNSAPNSAIHHNVSTPTMTPSSESRMQPPSLPRSLMTPARELRESSVASTIGGGSATRKPRQNLDERDQIKAMKACVEQKHNFKEGTKSQFWNGVNESFRQETGKVLAQMSATVGRLVEARRRQVCDWENGVIPDKPGGELNDLIDEWMEFLKVEDADAEAERMRQVDARRKVEESRKEARKAAIAAETLAQSQNPGVRLASGPAPPQPIADVGQPQSATSEPGYPQPPTPSPSQPNGQFDTNGLRPPKRRRITMNDRVQEQIHQEAASASTSAATYAPPPPTQLQVQTQPQPQPPPPQHYYAPPLPPPSPPRRVVVEGALTKEDWRDIMGNDARLRALEGKMEKIETLVTQNNKMLLQLLAHQAKEKDSKERGHDEEDRVPVHLDAEFERDYLYPLLLLFLLRGRENFMKDSIYAEILCFSYLRTGRYSKTPLPIN